MTAEKKEAIRISYPKHWFLMGTLMWALVTAVLGYIGFTSPTRATTLIWLTITGLVGILGFVFFVPPLFTSHWAGEKSLRFRMGLLVDIPIPYSWIREIRQTNVNWGGVRVGIGARYSSLSKTLFVTSEFSNLVALRLDGPHQLGRILRMRPEQIVVSVDAPWKLIDLVRKRAGLPEEG